MKSLSALFLCVLCVHTLEAQNVSYFNEGFLRQGNAFLDRRYLGILDNPINTNTPAGMTNTILAIGGGGGGGAQVWTNDATVPGIYPVGLMGNRTAIGLVSPSPSFNVIGADFYTNVPFFGYQYRTIIDVPNAVNGNFGGHINSAISGANVSLGLNANGWIDNSSITFAAQNDTNSGSFATIDLDSGAAAPHVFVGSSPTDTGIDITGLFKSPTNSPAIGQILQATSTAGDSAWAGGITYNLKVVTNGANTATLHFTNGLLMSVTTP